MHSKILRKIFITLLIFLIILAIVLITAYFLLKSIYTPDKKLPIEIENKIEAKYGLNEPSIHEQFFRMIKDKGHFDFGMSLDIGSLAIILVTLALIIYIIVRLRKKQR